jgi:hypothetical protein
MNKQEDKIPPRKNYTNVIIFSIIGLFLILAAFYWVFTQKSGPRYIVTGYNTLKKLY